MPPTTNVPNALMTWPAAPVPSLPWSRMRRVEATLSERRNRVTVSRTEGKTENSSGLRTNIDMSRITIATVMLSESSRSMTSGGSGTTMTMRMAITPTPISIAGFLTHWGATPALSTASAILHSSNVFRALPVWNSMTASADALRRAEVRKNRRSAKKIVLPLFRSSGVPLFRSSSPSCLGFEVSFTIRLERPLDGPLLESVHIGQDLGHGAVQVLRNRPIHIDRFIQ